jgi:acyl dehydratase
MNDTTYSLDNLNEFVGKEIGVSDWMEISQKRIDDFADVTEDRQWIHLDCDKATAGPFGAPIAHGLLLLSLTVKLADDAGALPAGASMCVNYGYDKIRFPAPVKAGQRVRCRAALHKVQEREPGRYLLTTRYTIEIEGENKPACVADCLGLFYR